MDRLRKCLAAAVLMMAAGVAAAAGAYEDMLHAVNNDDEAAVTQLLKKGMDVNTVGPHGDSLLMLAARHGKPQIWSARSGAAGRSRPRRCWMRART